MTQASEDPGRLLEELGATRPDEAPLDDEGRAALEALRARVQKNLVETQGPWRDSSLAARYWPIALAAVSGVAFIIMMAPSQLNMMLAFAVVLAALTGLVCFAAVLLAPVRPALSERFALAGIGLAAIAFGFEAYGGSLLGDEGFSVVMTLKCSGKFALGAAAPLVLLIFGLRRTGFPLRALHAAALTAAALALASVGVWRACTPEDMMHIALSHIALPALLIPLAGLAVWKLARRDVRLS